jgi:hypothetical protein
MKQVRENENENENENETVGVIFILIDTNWASASRNCTPYI